MAKEPKCLSCDGTGYWLLNRSWFTADGFTRERCHTCGGTGFHAYRPEADWIKGQRRKRALVAEWGGLQPKPQVA